MSYLIVDIKDSVLDFLIDFLGRVDEGLFDVGRGFGGRLHEDETVFSSEGLALLPLHISARFQITVHNERHINLGGQFPTHANVTNECAKAIGEVKVHEPLVANEHYDHVAITVLTRVFQPCRQVVERITSAKSRNLNHSHCCPCSALELGLLCCLA